MSEPSADRLIASGRAADVYDLGDGTVLRRYRDDRHDVAYEARVMAHVRQQGLRVPEVFDAGGRDIVMERIDGRTMMSWLEEQPLRGFRAVRLLADLQASIAAVAAPGWMMPPGWDVRSGGDPSVLHLDLHPLNVLLTDAEPVVIDWTNAAGGPPGFDAAMSYVVMATYEVQDVRDRVAQRALVATFRRARGKSLLDPFLAAACDHRLADPGVTPGERERVAELRRRYT